VISPIHTTFINIFVDPGTTFQSTNQQIWVFLQSFVKFRFTTSVLLFTYYFPLILGITYRVMFRG